MRGKQHKKDEQICVRLERGVLKALIVARSNMERIMDTHSTRSNSYRETIVSVMLTGMTAAFFLLLLALISGGYFVYLLLILIAIGAFGSFHYLLWGRLLSEETAGEREEEQLRQRALADDWPD